MNNMSFLDCLTNMHQSMLEEYNIKRIKKYLDQQQHAQSYLTLILCIGEDLDENIRRLIWKHMTNKLVKSNPYNKK